MIHKVNLVNGAVDKIITKEEMIKKTGLSEGLHSMKDVLDAIIAANGEIKFSKEGVSSQEQKEIEDYIKSKRNG
jgi:tellurite resistance protein|tara:strand:+ start:305 stop:526 length:222 start_codon:yes stop_codon:yes gene_type:complete